MVKAELKKAEAGDLPHGPKGEGGLTSLLYPDDSPRGATAPSCWRGSGQLLAPNADNAR